jgi:DNA-binding response OmpR family regulator
MNVHKSSVSIGAQPARVLLVDDNPDQLRLLIEALRSTSCRITVAMDGIQGYNRAVSIQPDLIILDVRMPRLDGFALCRRLKANEGTQHIPIIFLSSAADLEERLSGLGGGAVDYILKPYDADEVVARVKIHLRLAGKIQDQEYAVAPIPLSDDEVLVRAAQTELSALLSSTPLQADIAEKLGVHERRLARAFRSVLNTTMFEFLREERMKEARRLLSETSLSMVAIANELGFSTPANFSTAFREHAGVSPSEFRRDSSRATNS